MIPQIIIYQRISAKKINSVLGKKKDIFKVCSMNLDSSSDEQKLMIPGKIILSKSIIGEREAKLKTLSEKWKKERIAKENFDKKTLGWTKNSEILNGRTAMFFIVTGLLTEIWTGQTIPDQIETMVRTLGII
mmetsp:Transcript_1421/g.3615  ORF Transcript_1421/g.3615 Transcript_1421/m.3615 type:complete len:132 (-) Transcript_1421:384-779(-)